MNTYINIWAQDYNNYPTLPACLFHVQGTNIQNFVCSVLIVMSFAYISFPSPKLMSILLDVQWEKQNRPLTTKDYPKLATGSPKCHPF